MDARWLRPLGVGEVIDASFKIYRARFTTLLRAVAVVVIPVQLINVIVVLSLPSESTTTTDSFGNTSTSTANSGSVIAALLVLQILSLMSTFLAQAVCLKIVTDAYLGTVTGWKESLRFGLSKFFSVLWIAILSIFGVVIGFVLCIVPGIWLLVSWSVAIAVLLVEGRKGGGAMRRSFNLVRGRWWPTFGALLIAFLITMAVSFALSILSVPLILTDASFTTTQVANTITGAITSVLTTPISAAVSALIYFDLRVRKEGFDVALMAQRVGVDPPPGGFAPPPQAWGAPAAQGWNAPDAPWPGPPPTPDWPVPYGQITPAPGSDWSPPPPAPGTPPPPPAGTQPPPPPAPPWAAPPPATPPAPPPDPPPAPPDEPSAEPPPDA